MTAATFENAFPNSLAGMAAGALEHLLGERSPRAVAQMLEDMELEVCVCVCVCVCVRARTVGVVFVVARWRGRGTARRRERRGRWTTSAAPRCCSR